jgi:glycosyltransferase involved in cell wall biosynthesis
MFDPETLEVVMVSFEGPDQYSLAGGLGVRARELTRAFAAAGYATTLVFVGDPALAPDEVVEGVRLLRWCQEVSQHYPSGVYEGEWAKLETLNRTLPDALIERVVAPAVRRGRMVAVLCEEWHTAAFCRRLSDRLDAVGLRRHAVLVWNANNRFGWHEIDWPALGFTASTTTVSRYMKQLMLARGVNPVVIPNGIPESALIPPDRRAAAAIRGAGETPCLAFKIGRFTPDKRWIQAIDAIAELRSGGLAARLLMRGGIEPHGAEVLERARQRGLSVCDWDEPVDGFEGVVRALRASRGAAVVNLCRFLPERVIPEIDLAATAVLANSGHEPFGLVGLEAMAAGGVAVVGATGEEYARPYGNAVVIESDDGAEVAAALRGLVTRPGLARRLRRAARHDARGFAWPAVLEGLLERLRYMSSHQHVVSPEGAGPGGPAAAAAGAGRGAPDQAPTAGSRGTRLAAMDGESLPGARR